MRFTVNPSDGMPIYRQIMQQIVDAIAGGVLMPGDQLPSHRDLAQTLVVAPLTIKKAYDELERSGHIRMQRGQGSFVTEQPVFSEPQKLERLRPTARRLASEAMLLGVPLESVTAILRVEAEALDLEKSQ
jgi:GntR family transcriptional regulator